MTDDATSTPTPTDATPSPAPAPAPTPSDSLIADKPAALDFSLGKPEGFPDEFWDVEKKAPALDKMFNGYTQEKKRADGLRVKLSKGEFEGKPPEDVKEYTLELSDELKTLVPDDDIIFNAARQAAKDAGLPKEAFSKFMLPIISKLAEVKGAFETPATPEEIEADRLAEVEKLGPSGQRIVDSVASYIKELESGGTFSKEEAEAARKMCNSADAARVMNKLRMQSGRVDQVPISVPIDSASSRADIEKNMAEALMKGDEAGYNKYSAMLARMNNG